MILWLLQSIIVVVFILLRIAFFTLLERKFLSYSQTRVGPNKVIIGGVLQPVLDGGKLLIKEFFVPRQRRKTFFVILPGLFFVFMCLIWSIIKRNFNITSSSLRGICLIIVLGLRVYSTLLVGVSSFSKFGAIGGVRAASQRISYEITFSLIFFWRFFLWGGFSLGFNLSSPWLPLFIVFLFCLIADVNRAPFDFAEGERELIRGFNIEYGSLPFTLVFLGEYGIILGLSFVISSFFRENYFIWGVIFSSIIIFLRRTLPRFRYDILMGVRWFFILPISICFLFLNLII